MARATFQFEASDGSVIRGFEWLPDAAPKAIVHLAHGMGEHALRYDWVAEKLVDSGYAVFANDHRGHGTTAKELGQFGEDGWNRAIGDLAGMIKGHKARFPDIPITLFGHSMGAMLTAQFIETSGDLIDSAILSGSPGFSSWLQGAITRVLVRFEVWRKGELGESPLLQALLFDAANKSFEEAHQNPTGFEWLSRDESEVAKYVDDPLCGFVPCAGSLRDIFDGASFTQKQSSVSQIPRTLPIYIFSGDADPVHNAGKNLARLLKSYRRHGLDPSFKLYADGRHETLNEINRDEVIADVIMWLDQQSDKQSN